MTLYKAFDGKMMNQRISGKKASEQPMPRAQHKSNFKPLQVQANNVSPRKRIRVVTAAMSTISGAS